MYLIDHVAELRFVNRLIYVIKIIYTHVPDRPMIIINYPVVYRIFSSSNPGTSIKENWQNSIKRLRKVNGNTTTCSVVFRQAQGIVICSRIAMIAAVVEGILIWQVLLIGEYLERWVEVFVNENSISQSY